MPPGPMLSSAGYAPVAPTPGQNQLDTGADRTNNARARAIFEGHTLALRARSKLSLIWEKLLLHIDGSGDFQWADILYDQQIEIPRFVSEFRKTENLLRPVVENAVAHHVTMPLRYFAESTPDRRAREKSMMDTLWGNYLAQQQDFNGLFQQAMFLAMATGFCPVHRYWRDDVSQDLYEPVDYGRDPNVPRPYEPTQGMIDCWVGNPFDHVFDLFSKRGSVRSSSYGRLLPAKDVRAIFPQTQGMEGSSRISSAAEFQQIAASWATAGLGVHGSPVVDTRGSKRGSGEEFFTVICQETAPGQEWPQGHLEIIVVPGQVDARSGQGKANHAVMCYSNALPAADFSWTLFYSHHRYSDVHGKPWAEEIDQLQVDLNIARSRRWEVLNKMIEAPIVAPGGAIADDMAELGGYNLLEIEPSAAAWRPRVMEWPQGVLQGLDNEIKDLRSAIYTIGGYQAVSRGESPGSRTPFAAIKALQSADSSVHGPVNQRFRRSACDFLRGCHRQFKEFGDVGWFIEFVSGDEYAYLAEPYIDATKLSDQTPHYKLVNAFGATTEARAEEIIHLMQTMGADQVPFLRTDEARRQYPDQILFDADGDPKAVQRRRAKTVAVQFHVLAAEFRRRTGMQESDPSHPWVLQAANEVFRKLEQRFRRRREDDLTAHVATLSEITQDETSDPIAREAAGMRLELYYQWQASMAAGPAPGPGGPAAASGPDAMGGPPGKAAEPAAAEATA